MAARVSIVIPTYNRAGLVSRAIESALASGGVDVEVIVADDGSTDETPAVLAAFGRRISVCRQANRGQASARNAGFRQARGAFVAFLDSDDRLAPGALAQAVAALDAAPEHAAAYGRAQDVDPDGRVLSEWRTAQHSGVLLREIVRGLTLQLGQCVFRRGALAAIPGPFDEAARAGDDFKLFLQVAARHSFAYVPAVFVLRTVHDRMLTQAKRHVQEDLVERRLRFIREVFGAQAPAIERRHLGRRVLAEWYRTSGYQNASWGRLPQARAFMWKSLRQWPWQPRVGAWLAYQALPDRWRGAARQAKQGLAGGGRA
jgi:glycosyltransferase involved in cell wall biosynthesis